MDESSRDPLADLKKAFEGAVQVASAYSAVLVGATRGFAAESLLPFPREGIKAALFLLRWMMRDERLRELLCELYPDGAEQVRSGAFERGLTAGLKLLPGFIADDKAQLMEAFFAGESQLSADQRTSALAILERRQKDQEALLIEAERFGLPES